VNAELQETCGRFPVEYSTKGHSQHANAGGNAPCLSIEVFH
jgi:hypothetical protein